MRLLSDIFSNVSDLFCAVDRGGYLSAISMCI